MCGCAGGLAAAGVEQVQAPPGQPREAALRCNVRHSRDQNYDVKERPCWKIVAHRRMHRFRDGASHSRDMVASFMGIFPFCRLQTIANRFIWLPPISPVPSGHGLSIKISSQEGLVGMGSSHLPFPSSQEAGSDLPLRRQDVSLPLCRLRNT